MNKKWYPCELHCHTVHSDGGFTVKELMKTAKERHLSGICLTDHNTTSGHAETDAFSSPEVLRGIEWTTYFGHMLVLDCKGDIDWRDALPDNIDEKMKAVHAGGGLVGIAHPFQLGTPVCTGGHWDYNVKDFSLVNYMEIWSEGEPLMNAANEKAKKMWLSLLGRGCKIAPTFGRDWHRKTGNILKGACTALLIDGEITAEKMKEAIEKGRTQLTLGLILNIKTDTCETVGDTVPSGKRTFTVNIDRTRADLFSQEYSLEAEALRVITRDGETAYEGKAEKRNFSLDLKENSFYIFELWGKINDRKNQLIALTAALYT